MSWLEAGPHEAVQRFHQAAKVCYNLNITIGSSWIVCILWLPSCRSASNLAIRWGASLLF